MSAAKREKRFLDAVRASGLVPEDELQRALRFQEFARTKGKPLPLDRILLKFGLLDPEQIAALYQALRYFVWRKEDKFYGKVAVQSGILTEADVKSCLSEQKNLFAQVPRELRRLNEVALTRNLLTPKEDRAIVRKMREVKPKLTIVPLDGNPLVSGEQRSPLAGPPPGQGLLDSTARRGPARAGEEEQWRRDVRARELAELSGASAPSEPGAGEAGNGDDSGLLDALGERDEDSPLPAGGGSSPGGASSRGGGGSSSRAAIDDEDLDPLWAEADLDDVELDSDQRDASGDSRGGKGHEDATDHLA